MGKQFGQLRLRGGVEVADYSDESAHQIVTKEDYDSMQVKVATLKREIAILEKLPFDQVKEENEQLKLEHATLEAQLEQANIDYENETNQKAIMDANYADLEEALADKIKEYEDTTRLDNLNRELSGIEVDFGKIKGDVARRLQNLKTLRASKQSEIDEIMDENKFLVGRHRTNHLAIHELIQERLSSANVANVIEEL